MRLNRICKFKYDTKKLRLLFYSLYKLTQHLDISTNRDKVSSRYWYNNNCVVSGRLHQHWQ